MDTPPLRRLSAGTSLHDQANQERPITSIWSMTDMTAPFTQDFDIFADAIPGITFADDDQTGTIAGGVLVASGQKDGIFSDQDGSVLINNGSILSARLDGVNFIGNHASMTNSAGAQIIGSTGGVRSRRRDGAPRKPWIDPRTCRLRRRLRPGHDRRHAHQ